MSCSCCCGPSAELPCGCCEGIERLTPQSLANRPGLDALAYRAATHATFLESMKARLADHVLGTEKLRPLRALTARGSDDPAIAFMDGWAVVGDVLTFYQERIANEGFLRTAQERRSILELARLVGYELRPGVASSVYLAFTMEKDQDGELPAGTRAQSVPGPGELPQSFETAEKLKVRYAWNTLKPRTTAPQTFESIRSKSRLYLKGRAVPLKANDPLLVSRGTDVALYRVTDVAPDPDPLVERTLVRLRAWTASAALPDLKTRVRAVAEKFSAIDRFGVSARKQRTKQALRMLDTLRADTDEARLAEFVRGEVWPLLAELRESASADRDRASGEWLRGMHDEVQNAIYEPSPASVGEDAAAGQAGRPDRDRGEPGSFFERLAQPPSVPPRSSSALLRNVGELLGKQADGPIRALTELRPPLKNIVYTAFRNLPPPEPELRVYRLREAAVFGHNAPPKVTYVPESKLSSKLVPQFEEPTAAERSGTTLFLDTAYDGIPVGGYLGVGASGATKPPSPFRIVEAAVGVRTKYGLSGRTTILTLESPWFEATLEFKTIRRTIVYLPGDLLETVEAPIDTLVQGTDVDLAALYDGLDAGRWLIVTGDRDVGGGIRVPGAELVMLDGITQLGTGSPPDNPKKGGTAARTKLRLALKGLAYKYVPSTVAIYGNVARATHGETRSEVLGSGDGSQPLQAFPLRQPPLTYVSAPTARGAESTLRVRVNDVLWHESDNLAGIGPTDRRYITRTGDDSKTTVVFGNGLRGARLPTGVENVKAVYRKGIGKGGNVEAGRITLLATKPLGLKEVINPVPATGGADRDSPDQGRRNAPLAVTALDRLVSVQDYADFARTFAGVGKAVATRVSDGRRQLVHVTIAGADDIPIDETSDLFRNLLLALHTFGEPYQPIQLDVREVLLLLLSARVKVLPDYAWESVEPKVRVALLEAFGFERRDLGQDAVLSEVISSIQGVTGVADVDVDVFDHIPGKREGPGGSFPTPEEIAKQVAETVAQQLNEGPLPRVSVSLEHPGTVRPAEIAYFSPALPDTLILREWTP